MRKKKKDIKSIKPAYFMSALLKKRSFNWMSH
jgi:hypothetical protein